MKAAVYNTFNGAIEIKQVDDPVLTETEAIIEVRASGICRSDWHEFSGIVKEVGSKVSLFQAGDRVTAPFCCGCSTCPQCMIGNQHICDMHFQP